MVDWGGVSVPELSQNTKDGILDPSNLRPSPATASNPFATLADVSGATLNMLIQGKTVSGKPDFFSLPGGTNIRLLASSGVPFQYYVSGIQRTLIANVDLALTDNANNFIWVNSAGTLGRSALPCRYSFDAPGAPATDQHWFNLGANHMYRWDGAAWASVDRIFIGYSRVDSAVPDPRYGCEPFMLAPMDRYSKLGDGSDGFLDISSGTTTIDGLHRYTAVIIRGTGKLKHTANGPLPMHVKVQGLTVLCGIAGSGINLDGLGFGNKASGKGEGGGLGGGGGGSGNVAGVDGGDQAKLMNYTTFTPGGLQSITDNVQGGTGPAAALDARGIATVPTNLYGNQGGGSQLPNGGGKGGGAMVMWCAAFWMNAITVLSSNGLDGGITGGAGGGGGIIIIFARSVLLTGTASAVGGQGGAEGGGQDSAGGIGGAGGIYSQEL